MDSITTNNSECNSIENSENILLSNNEEFLNVLNNGVKLSSKSSIAPAINMLVENNVIPVDKKESIINVLNDSFGLGTQMTPAAALLMIKKGDFINIAKMSHDGRDNEILFGRIDQGGIFTKEPSGKKPVDFTFSLVTDSIDITGKLDTKNTEGNQLKRDCKNNLGKLVKEMSNINSDKGNFNLTYNNQTQSPEEITAGVISGKKDIDGTDGQVLLTEDVLGNHVNQVELSINNKTDIEQKLNDTITTEYTTDIKNKGQVSSQEEKETISYIDYTVKSGDNLWKIMRNKYGLTHPTDIANLLNLLIQDGKFGINDLKTPLKIGQKLQLPSEIFVKSPSRGNNNMKLKTN